MATSFPYGGQGQGREVVVHVHVHLHGDEKAAGQQVPLQMPLPQVLSSPVASPPPAPAPALPAPPAPVVPPPPPPLALSRSVHPRPLPRLLYSQATNTPLPIFSRDTPVLAEVPTQREEKQGDNVKYVYRQMDKLAELRSLDDALRFRSAGSRTFDNGDFRFESDRRRGRTVERDVFDKQGVDYNRSANMVKRAQTEFNTDSGMIFEPGVKDRYVRNVQRQTFITPGVRAKSTPNLTETQIMHSNLGRFDQVDQGKVKVTVTDPANRPKPLKSLFSDRTNAAPISFNLQRPRFSYSAYNTSSSSSQLNPSSSSSSSSKRHVAWDKAKTRTIFVDEKTGKTYKVHSITPIEEEGPGFDSLVYKENPAAMGLSNTQISPNQMNVNQQLNSNQQRYVNQQRSVNKQHNVNSGMAGMRSQQVKSSQRVNTAYNVNPFQKTNPQVIVNPPPGDQMDGVNTGSSGHYSRVNQSYQMKKSSVSQAPEPMSISLASWKTEKYDNSPGSNGK